MGIDEWIEWMRNRPNRKARQRRLFDALDSAMPDWERALALPEFKMWANWRHPITNKTRLDILKALSLGNYDGLNTARLIKVAQQEVGILQNYGTICVDQNKFLGHGSIIDKRYEVILPLGMGGCGVVAMVYSHEVEEFFALKMIRSELLTDVNSRARFVQEANLWVDLGSHINIVQAEFVDKFDNEIVILMELIDPGMNGFVSLQDHISNTSSIPLEQAVTWAIGICQGMSHAYSMNIKAHRDLKPDNVLITDTDIAKVTDFGISSLMQSSLADSAVAGRRVEVNKTANNAIIGTLPYMAPEQFINAHDCDERSDIYSFGIILYQLISKGRWPYGDIQSLVKRVHHDELPVHFFQLHSQAKPKFLFHKLFKITKACLQKQPSKRPASFQHIKRILLEATNNNNQIKTTNNETPFFDPWETGRRAASLLRLGRYEEALVLFDEILEKFPIGVQWEFDKALTLSKLGRNDEAFALYTKIIKRDPTDLGALINKGLLCQNSGDLSEAERLFTAALKYHPDDLDALINLGNLSYKQENYEAAGAYYTQTVEIDPQYATGWYNLALSFKANGLIDHSNQCFANFLECSDPLDSRKEYVLKVLGQSE